MTNEFRCQELIELFEKMDFKGQGPAIDPLCEPLNVCFMYPYLSLPASHPLLDSVDVGQIEQFIRTCPLVQQRSQLLQKLDDVRQATKYVATFLRQRVLEWKQCVTLSVYLPHNCRPSGRVPNQRVGCPVRTPWPANVASHHHHCGDSAALCAAQTAWLRYVGIYLSPASTEAHSPGCPSKFGRLWHLHPTKENH